MKKYCFLQLILMLCLCSVQLVKAQTKRPNVLFILTDDENVNTLGCYGNKVKTPNIDQLAERGIRFTNANVVHTVCSPSRYSILTGRYYQNNYHPEFLESFPADEPSCVGNTIMLENDGMNIAGILRQNGYQTGFVGKFHLGRHDVLGNNKNWEANGLQTYGTNTDPRVDEEMNRKLKENHEWWCEAIKTFGFDYVNGVYSANLREFFNTNMKAHNVEWTADAAVKFIDQQKDNTDPFFLYVATTYPHGPMPERQVQGKYVASLDADPTITGEGIVTKNAEAKRKRRMEIKENTDPSDDKTSATAQWWDAAVGDIIKKLKETGQYENTLIIYTSDHGKNNGGKTTLYEGGVHVPLIVHWSSKISTARTFDHVVGSVDFVPTILDACQVQQTSEMRIDGISFNSVISGSNVATRQALLMQMGYATAVKTDDWKYITLRYPVDIEEQIQRGEKFVGHQRETIVQPYYMLHKQLSQKAAKNNTNYFERNQLYDYKKQVREKNNRYLENKKVASEMHKLLEVELKKINADRPYGEFVGKDKRKLNYLKDVVYFPRNK